MYANYNYTGDSNNNNNNNNTIIGIMISSIIISNINTAIIVIIFLKIFDNNIYHYLFIAGIIINMIIHITLIVVNVLMITYIK